MAIPTTAKALPQAMDPSEILDWSANLTQGPDTDSPVPLLRPSESVASFTLTPTVEATAAGLRIKSGAGYPAPTLVGLALTFWLEIDPAMTGAAVFGGNGLTLALELTVDTTSNPPRRRQKTLTVQVAQQ